MAKNGTTVAIRKFSKDDLTLTDLINFGSLSKEGARFLDICIYLGKNIVVSGGTGSGKTTMLNVLGGRIENTKTHYHRGCSRAQRPLNMLLILKHEKKILERSDGVNIRTVISAMRLRPDRIIVGR